MEFLWSLPGTVELTHNHGSEAKEGKVYHSGNNYDGVNEGFGHIGITVRGPCSSLCPRRCSRHP